MVILKVACKPKKGGQPCSLLECPRCVLLSQYCLALLLTPGTPTLCPPVTILSGIAAHSWNAHVVSACHNIVSHCCSLLECPRCVLLSQYCLALLLTPGMPTMCPPVTILSGIAAHSWNAHIVSSCHNIVWYCCSLLECPHCVLLSQYYLALLLTPGMPTLCPPVTILSAIAAHSWNAHIVSSCHNIVWYCCSLLECPHCVLQSQCCLALLLTPGMPTLCPPVTILLAIAAHSWNAHVVSSCHNIVSHCCSLLECPRCVLLSQYCLALLLTPGMPTMCPPVTILSGIAAHSWNAHIVSSCHNIVWYCCSLLECPRCVLQSQCCLALLLTPGMPTLCPPVSMLSGIAAHSWNAHVVSSCHNIVWHCCSLLEPRRCVLLSQYCQALLLTPGIPTLCPPVTILSGIAAHSWNAHVVSSGLNVVRHCCSLLECARCDLRSQCCEGVTALSWHVPVISSSPNVGIAQAFLLSPGKSTF